MIRPTKDNVLLVLDPDVPERTAAGVYAVTLQPKGKEPYGNRIGTVLAAGPGYSDDRGRFHPVEVKPGERVIVHTTAGDRYTYTKRQDMADMYGDELDRRGVPRDSAEFRMVRFDEVLGVIEGDEAEEGVAAE